MINDMALSVLLQSLQSKSVAQRIHSTQRPCRRCCHSSDRDCPLKSRILRHWCQSNACNLKQWRCGAVHFSLQFYLSQMTSQDDVQQKWSALDANFVATQHVTNYVSSLLRLTLTATQSFHDLQSVITGLTLSLEVSLSQVVHAQETQREVAESISLLDDKISQLTNATHRELETINQTALALIGNLQRKSKHEAWLFNLQWLLHFITPSLCCYPLGQWSLTCVHLSIFTRLQDFSSRCQFLGILLASSGSSIITSHGTRDLLLRYCYSLMSLLQTSAAVSSVRRQLLQKFRGSKQAQLNECFWNLDSPEGSVPSISNVGLLQRTMDPRIIRRLARPRISRIPDRICHQATQETLHGPYSSAY